MIPKLRFKADDGSEFPEWEKKKLGDNVNFINGRAYSQDELLSVGKYQVLRVGNLFTNDTYYYSNMELESDKYIEDGDLIYAWSATFGPRIYTGNKCIYHYHIWKLKFDEKIVSKKFLNYMLEHDVEKIMSQRTGGTMVHITKSTMENRELFFPSLPEQKKIASFLSTIDDIITTTEAELTAWEERKKGVMQKIFNREVRFKADDGSEFPEWEEKKMTQLFTRIVEKNRTDLSPLTIIQGQGTVRRDESDRRIAYDKKGLKNYKAVKKDDFIVHLRSFEGGLEIANQDGIVSPAYHVYRGSGNVCPQFYYPYFRSNNFIKGRLAICVTGVRDGKNIEMDTFDELLLPCPSFPEQEKIAECLSSLNDVINQIKTELSAWKEFKKGLLQQMFV